MSDEPAKRGRGRPAFVPTDDERWIAQVLHAHGIPHAIIARSIRRNEGGIGIVTLRKYFKAELRDAQMQVKATMVASLIRAGINGNVGAIRYWLSCWGGPEWRVPAGAEGEAPPIPGNTTIIIKGGLPPVMYTTTATDDLDGDQASAPKPNGAGANGAGGPH